jgi:hypothetical protein
MDVERIKEFGQMVENLGNPNDIVREKHTSDLLRTIHSSPVDSLLTCIALLYGRLLLMASSLGNSSQEGTVDYFSEYCKGTHSRECPVNEFLHASR